MRRKTKNFFSYQKGFTIIEMMLVVIIIGVAVSFAVPTYMTSKLKAEEQKGLSTVYAYAEAQKAFWFDANPHSYTQHDTDLIPSYVSLPSDDGNWQYAIASADTTSFVITAIHMNALGIPDGLTLSMNQSGLVTRGGPWPY